MNNRIKIKVIKKDEIKIVGAPLVTKESPELNDTTKLTSTVSTWIDEFQQRRRQETESAIEQFYS
jgi:hypothetical protein